MEMQVHNKRGETVGKILVDDGKFGKPIRSKLLRDAVTMYEANKRVGTASTKTKGEVAGGGKKPWVQKHTGRARAGSIRSPLWKGGGASFGPKPRDYSYLISKRAKREALYSALSSKVIDNELVVVEDLGFDLPKTKQIVEVLKILGMGNDSCLIVTSKIDEVVWKSSRNIPYIRVVPSSELNAYDVLRSKKMLITKEAIGDIK